MFLMAIPGVTNAQQVIHAVQNAVLNRHDLTPIKEVANPMVSRGGSGGVGGTDSAKDLINSAPVSSFPCRYCDSTPHLRYFDNKSHLESHIINEHPEQWPRQLHDKDIIKWSNSRKHNRAYKKADLVGIYNSYLKIRAMPEAGLGFVITDRAVTWYDRASRPVEKLLYTHARGLNAAMKISGRTDKAVRAVLNGGHGDAGYALIPRNKRNKDEGSWSISWLAPSALQVVQNLRAGAQLEGYGNTPQLLDLIYLKTQETAEVIEVEKPEVTSPEDMIPTAVVDTAPTTSESLDLSELLKQLTDNPDMDWTTFSSSLGTAVFQEYLQLVNVNATLLTIKEELESTMRYADRRIDDLMATNAELTQKLEIPSNKSAIKAEFEATTAQTIRNLAKK